MDYWFSVSTPANTLKEDAIETPMKVTEGIVTHVWIKHPFGCQGLAHATISDGLSQIWPTNKDEDYHGDGFPMEWDEAYEVHKPAKFYLNTWNDDDTHLHNVAVRISILPKELVSLLPLMSFIEKLAKRIFGES